MTQINLLPWRAQQREQNKRRFIVISLTVAAFALLLLVLLWSYLLYQLEEQKQANQLVHSSHAQLDVQLKQQQHVAEQRQQMLAKMQVIQSLQGQRPITARLIDELVRLMPTDLYVTKLSRHMNSLTIEGKASSPHVVANLLTQLETSKWFQQATMQSFVAHDPSQPLTAVRPQLEDAYGRYVVTVDLAEIALSLPQSMSPAGAKNETTKR